MKKLSAKQYANRLWAVWSTTPTAQHHDLLTAFFQMLQRQHALKSMPRILTHLQTLEDQAAGLTRVQVVSAVVVDQPKLASQLKNIFGPVIIDAAVIPSLIAGLKIQIGDQLIDASTANQLRRLQTHLTHA